MAMRRDFPLTDCHAVVIAPRHLESGDLQEEQGPLRSMAFSFQPHEESDKVLFTLVQKWLVPSALMIPSAVNAAMHFMHRKFTVPNERCLQEMHASLGFASSVGYVVLSLRKCTRGNPLVPTESSSDDEWVPVEGPKVAFAAYLQLLCRRLGFTDTKIHDSLDGRLLVPYQATMQKSDWECLWPLLKEPWNEQRTWYRRRFGGTCAPEIGVSLPARFRVDLTSTTASVQSAASLEVEPASFWCEDDKVAACSLPVLGTFVHFRVGLA